MWIKGPNLVIAGNSKKGAWKVTIITNLDKNKKPEIMTFYGSKSGKPIGTIKFNV